MSKETRPTPAEVAMFREAMSKVRRLKSDRVAPERPKRAPVPEQRLRDEQEVLREMAQGLYDSSEIETGDELLFVRPGIQHSLTRKLRRGQLSIEGELDLHGQTVAEAKESLVAFLSKAQDRGWRCVRIVHGKGLRSQGRMPVLKGKVNHWLQQLDAVLAFSSTRPADGGTGAVYVLLKRG
ncbi:MAG TPA: Smr/MutS family protein [Gammaproteobacteria bacterium]|nr:Smr/MutS family protein [Gammaproteobacteria bacterium]